MEDSKIIDLYWERNEKAISATEQKYGSYCYYIAYNILHDQEDADESVNDTYLGAWNAIPPHRPNMLRTFLGKITRSISLKKWRDAHRDKRGGDEVSLVPQKSRVKAEKTKIFFQKASSGFGDVSFKERSGRFKA